MSKAPNLVAWSPYETDHFAVSSGQDLRYYRCDLISNPRSADHASPDYRSSNISGPSQDSSRGSAFSLVEVNVDIQGAKCMSWCPDPSDSVLALGFGTGKVLLHSFSRGRGVLKELFSPKQNKSCNALAWNPVYNNLLAVGFEKIRSENCVLVWDVLHRTPEAAAALPSDIARQRSFSPALSSQLSSSSSRPRSFSSSSALSSPPPSSSASSSNIPEASFLLRPAASSLDILQRPVAEFSNSEAAHSLAWLPDQPHCLSVATGAKFVRIYDLRGDVAAPRSILAHPKGAIHSVCFDPITKTRFATISEDSVIRVWDTRRMGMEPISTFSTAIRSSFSPITHISWSTSIPDTLASISKSENMIRLWNVNTSINQDDIPSASSSSSSSSSLSPASSSSSASSSLSKSLHYKNSPYRAIYTSDDMSSMSWHPKLQGRVMCASNSGVIQYHHIHDTPVVAWSPQAHFSTGFDASAPASSSSMDQSEEMSMVMKSRASQGYGMNASKNKIITSSASASSHQKQSTIWEWIARIQEWNEKSGCVRPDTFTYPGVSAILGYEPDSADAAALRSLGSEADLSEMSMSIMLSDFSIAGEKLSCYPTFQSPRRALASFFCGWENKIRAERKVSASEILGNSSQQSPSNGADLDLERNVAMAIFSLDLRLAIYLLTKASPSSEEQSASSSSSIPSAAGAAALSSSSADKEHQRHYKFFAFALGGYSEDRRVLWRDLCRDLSTHIQEPYLKAAINFLACDKSDYSLVLDDNQLTLPFRIAFACRFLPDDELKSFITRAKAKAISSGDLHGLVVTGLNADAAELLQSFVDRTADVQTAAVIMSHVVPRRFRDARVQSWLELYRDLLDQWRMWHERAELDASLSAHLLERSKPTPTMVVRCNFCNQPLVQSSVTQRRTGGMTKSSYSQSSASAAVKPKPTSCPGCRKPLPRCAVCLLSFGSSDASLGRPSSAPASGLATSLSPQPPFGRPALPASASSSSSLPSPALGPSPRPTAAAGTPSSNPSSPAISQQQQTSSPSTAPASSFWSFGPDFDHWFTWCQTCRHGGHASHIVQWFEKNSSCPVSGCQCKCMELDAGVR